MVGLVGGLIPKTEKSSDMGTCSLLSPAFPWPSIFSGRIFASNPSRCGITLLDFLGGDNTTGPSRELKSETLGFADSRLGGGLGSRAGSVGRGPDEKYLMKRESSAPTSTASPQTTQDKEETYLCSKACCADILAFGSYENIFDRRSKASSVAVGNNVFSGCPGTYWYST